MSRRALSGFLIALALVPGVVANAASVKHDEVTIVVDNKSQSDGEISFTFKPEGGEPKEVKVGVIAKMKPDEIARDIMKSFSLALGDDYKVKMKADEKVGIEGNPKIKDRAIKFTVVLSGVSASGVSVAIK